MKHILDNQLKYSGLCIVLVCSLFIANVVHTEEVIFQASNGKYKGIWKGDIDGNNAHSLIEPPIIVSRFSVQKGNLCVGVGKGIEDGVDVYLFDSKNWGKGRKDLTYGRFSRVSDAAISPQGDVIFSNKIFGQFPDGIYLIPNDEIHETLPKAEKLYDGPANYVDWSPNGREVVFSNDDGIFMLDVITKQVAQILGTGYRPIFAPDGNKLAFLLSTPAQNNRKSYREVSYISLDAPKEVNILRKTKTDLISFDLIWTPDSKSIAYTLVEIKGFVLFFPILEYTNFLVSIENQRTKRIFESIEGGVESFEWTQVSYPVEPESRLTTTWGQVKRETENGGSNE